MHDAWLPQSSVAVQVLVIVVVVPQPGVSTSENVIATPPQVSLPVATPVSPGSVDELQSPDTLAGQVIVGGVVSTTVIV